MTVNLKVILDPNIFSGRTAADREVRSVRLFVSPVRMLMRQMGAEMTEQTANESLEVKSSNEQLSEEQKLEERILEEQYLEFISADYLFLLPVSWVVRVIEKSKKPEELPVIDISGRNRAADGERSLLILLEKQERTAGIAADRVIGIRKVDSGRLLELEEPVINERNRYLKAAAVMKEDGKTKLELVLNPEVLLKGTGL